MEKLQTHVGDRISNVRKSINERLVQSGGHIGRSQTHARDLSDFLASKEYITPNRITVMGGVIGSIGAALAAEPREFSYTISKVTKGKLNISERQLKRLGLAAALLGYGADAMDGAVAQAKEERGETGYTRVGRLLDGVSDKVLENAGPLAILHFPSESKTEKPGWALYGYFSNLSTLIRSVGVEHGIGVEKTGSGSRGDIESVFGVGHMISTPFIGERDHFWRGRGSHGAILTAMRMRSAWTRWNRIMNSGNTDAIENLKKDVIEFTLLNIAGYNLGKLSGVGGTNGQFIFGLAKTMDVVSGEKNAFGKRLSISIADKIHTHFFREQ